MSQGKIFGTLFMLDSDNLYCYLMKGLFELWQGNQIVQLPYLLYCGINNVVLCI